jgi:hypothetical protein
VWLRKRRGREGEESQHRERRMAREGGEGEMLTVVERSHTEEKTELTWIQSQP